MNYESQKQWSVSSFISAIPQVHNFKMLKVAIFFGLLVMVSTRTFDSRYLQIHQIWLLINYLIDKIWFFSLIKNTTEVGTEMSNAKLGCDFGEYTCGNICCPFSCFCCTKSTNKEFCECTSFCPWCKFHIHIEPLNLNRKYRVKWSSLNKNVHNYISTTDINGLSFNCCVFWFLKSSQIWTYVQIIDFSLFSSNCF